MATDTLLTSARSRSFIEQQNLVRGAFAHRRKGGFNDAPRSGSLLDYRTIMRRTLLKARAALDSSEYPEFLDWLTRQHRVEFPTGTEGAIGYDFLNGVIEGPTIPLPKELTWLVARMAQNSDVLARFRSSASKLDTLIVSGLHAEAIDLLADITTVHGESMWAIQLRIALEQKAHGLEAQKAFYENVRSKYRRGILAYIAYHTSGLNEDRTSWQRFFETLEKDLSRRKDRAIADYFQYRLLNAWPENTSGIENVLRVEQSHSIIDQYETLVSLFQELISRPQDSSLHGVVGAACEVLAGIGDFRLANLAHRSRPPDVSSSGLRKSDRDVNELDADLAGNPSGMAPGVDPWAIISQAYSTSSEAANTGVSSPFCELLTRFIKSNGRNAADIGDLEKLCHVFRGLPVANSMLAFVRGLYPMPGNKPFRFDLVDLNSPAAPQGLGDRWLSFPNEDNASSGQSARIVRALQFFRADEFQLARDALESPKHFGGGPHVRLMELVWLWCSEAIPDHIEVISSISRIGSRSPSQIALLPIERMIGHLSAAQYKQAGDQLAPLNALNMLWKSTESDRVASTLRLMTGQYLRRPDVGAPSTLIEKVDQFDKDELVYFLRDVCVPSVLDVSRVFSSSQAVQEERQAIYAVLNSLDPENSAFYSDEVMAISRRLRVDEGLRIVDQSRVHVDTEAVTRWALRTLTEDFERYNDLARAGIGSTGNFDDALRELKAAISRSKQGEFFTPQNEADNALIRLLRAIREEFLNSSSRGLDYFLSKRIRHVSFIGLVRGPLEFAHLISTKPTANSAYGSNAYWLDRLNTLSLAARDGVDDAIKAFSERFDNALNRLKSQVLHVRSDDRPEGIFEIPLNTSLLIIGRALLRDNLSFEEFLQTVYMIFWAALEPSLQGAREIIDGELKMSIARDIDELKAEIAKFAQYDPAFAEVSAALAQASIGVQAALSDASSWFTRPEIREATRYFSLEEALDVAIESALKLNRSFSPKISRRVDGEISLSAPDLIFITDAILVAFSNISAYSKLDTPDVSLLLRLDEANEVLIVEVENEVSSRARSYQQDARIAQIASAISDGNQKTNTEGGSGFIKLAAVVQQSARGRIEFGYIGPTTFKLTVAYSIIIGSSFMTEYA